MKRNLTGELRNLLLSLPGYLLFPNAFGILLASGVFSVLHFGLPLLRKLERAKKADISLEQVCEFIEIFLLGTNAGLTKLETLNLVAETVTDPLQSEVSEVITRCNMGIGLATSLTYTTIKYPKLSQTIKIISRSEVTGGSITEALELELLLARSQAANDVMKRVRSLSVKCVLPLGLCFLPAFFLATIVPIIASLVPTIFSTLR